MDLMQPSMDEKRNPLNSIGAFLLLLGVVALVGCPPPEVEKDVAGEFLVGRNKLFGADAKFDIRDEVVYPVQAVEGLKDPGLSVTNEKLTLNRCTWCHECGFEEAFDWKNYGKKEWNPRYKGDEWIGPVTRMRDKENTFIQEEMIVKRIFEFLRDVTTGQYDVEADDKGAVRIEVDELPTPLTPGAEERVVEDG